MASNQELSAFIRGTFRSVWALELLLLLKTNKDRRWAHTDMVMGLRGSDLVVTQSLDALSAAGLVLVEADGSARYNPVSPEVERLVEETEAFYARSPDAVRRMIVSSASGDLAAFADAFRLWKD